MKKNIKDRALLISLIIFSLISTIHGCFTYKLIKEVNDMAFYHKAESLIDDDQIEELKDLISDNSNKLEITVNKFDSIQPTNTTVTTIHKGPELVFPTYKNEFKELLSAIDRTQGTKDSSNAKYVKNLIYALNLKHSNDIDSLNSLFEELLSDCLDSNKVVNTFSTTGATFKVHTNFTGRIYDQYVSGMNIIGIDTYKNNGIGAYAKVSGLYDNPIGNTFMRGGVFYRRKKNTIFVGTALNGSRNIEIGLSRTLYEW